MAGNRFVELCDAEAGTRVVLQGNLAFAVGCARGGLHGADGYPGTPSTEVIDKGLCHVQDRMTVGWSVNEATAVNVGLGFTMAGGDMVVTMKVPGLFQAADALATLANFTAPRGGLVLFVASDFVPSSTQYVWDPRYFLKACFIPILEPRTHQEMIEVAPLAAALSRQHATPVAVLANGLLCHSEGLVSLPTRQSVPRLAANDDYTRFMNLPEIARRNYQQVVGTRWPGLSAHSEQSPLNEMEWHDRSLGVVVHGITERYLREAWPGLPVKPSLLSLYTTWPLPIEKARQFAAGIQGRVVVLGDGLRFVQEELASHGIAVEGKGAGDALTEWSPHLVAHRLGAARPAPRAASALPPITRPATICAGCPYRAFGLAVQRLRKKKKIAAVFGDIGCNTLLHFLDATDTCACMGASDSARQGAVLCDATLADRAISVIGDSTECHSGLAATRNAVFRHTPGVQIVLDNLTTAMTGGQPAPTSKKNLAGQSNRLDLVAALRAEGAQVQLLDAFDMAAIEAALRAALEAAGRGEFTALVIRGDCVQELPAKLRVPRFTIDRDKCKKCDLCLICPGLERDDEGYPRFTHLCNGCGGYPAICVQRCNLDAIVPITGQPTAEPPPPPPLAELETQATAQVAGLPAALRVAVR
ncbi:MAG: pyruvate ferredoxin oxidoreductase, partial [Deltaproteobacteria bacterium]|nr:pyruvate ferredoxin oxidoreductase [Deltaproteobacteria bacterium]